MSPERAGAAAAALGPARGEGRGGAAPPLRLPPGAQPRGPASGHPRRAGGSGYSGCCAGARSGAHPPDAPTPAPSGSGSPARTALSCALQRRWRWRRPGKEEGEGEGGMNHRGGRARPPSLCRSGPGGARCTGLSRWRRDRGLRAWAHGLGVVSLQTLGTSASESGKGHPESQGS